jgi:putative ABC transport system permease protein
MKQDFSENLKLAMDTLRGHKLRSFLTVLGVVIGVCVIILVVGLLDGFKRAVQEEILIYGADTAWVDRYSNGPGGPDSHAKERRERPPLSLAQGQAIESMCPSIKAVAISLFEWESPHNVRYQGNSVQAVELRGTFPSFAEVYGNAEMRAGRFFTSTENLHADNVLVIGEDVAKALFPNINGAVGHEIIVDGSTFLVIGVFEKPKGGFGMSDEDRRVVMPYNTFHKFFPAAFEHGFRILAYPGQLDKAVDQAREVLRRQRNVAYAAPDNFSITTQLEQVQQFNDIVGGVVLATVVISSVGLLIGGVGVMNIMLVSVTERTREIGVRKAIGARRKDITWQFLFEAMTLTGTGGVLGILVGIGIVLLISWLSPIRTAVSPVAVLIGEVVSIGIGLIFGVWPAVKAARLDPVDALRYE